MTRQNQSRLCMRVVTAGLFSALLTLWLTPLGPWQVSHAQEINTVWTDFVDISHTPTASTYPAIAADQAGNVHVIWSEDTGGVTYNPSFNPGGTRLSDARGHFVNTLTAAGKALFYTRWNGTKWLDPIDILSDAQIMEYPAATVDRDGTLHLVWVGGGVPSKLYYSRAPAERAESARAWSRPEVLADPVLFAYYPADIVADASGGLHLLYSQLGSEAGVYVRNSDDGGLTWSEPISLYPINDPNGTQEGASPVRLQSDAKGRLHATWTRYDASGNGKGIYYSRSDDQGQTWSSPFEVAAWQPGWYEVDWLSVGVAGDEIHLVWEGSSAVAALMERISADGGLTWSEPHQILPRLVGENGFADLVTDSAGNLHLLVVKRGDPDAQSHGVWYSTWDKGRWSEPALLGTRISSLYAMLDRLDGDALRDLLQGTLTGNGLRYQRSVIVAGNVLVTVVVNEWDGDLWSSRATLDAPPQAAQPFLLPHATPTLAPTQLAAPELVAEPASSSVAGAKAPQTDMNASSIILLGALSGALSLAIVVISLVVWQRTHS